MDYRQSINQSIEGLKYSVLCVTGKDENDDASTDSEEDDHSNPHPLEADNDTRQDFLEEDAKVITELTETAAEAVAVGEQSTQGRLVITDEDGGGDETAHEERGTPLVGDDKTRRHPRERERKVHQHGEAGENAETPDGDDRVDNVGEERGGRGETADEDGLRGVAECRVNHLQKTLISR